MKKLMEAVEAALAALPPQWQDKPLMVMVSGGADSTALLLAALGARGERTVLAFHAEHGLRGAAGERDAAFVRGLCERLNVPVTVASLALSPDLPGLEERARAARYAAAAQAAQSAGAVLLAAHHAGDQAETVLMRLLRGAGTHGLGGMQPLSWLPDSTPLLRPFLALPKAALTVALGQLGQKYVTDETNLSPCVWRNRLRLEVMPLLTRLAPGAEAAMGRAAACLRADDALLSQLADALLIQADEAPYAALWLPPLLSAPEALQRRALRRYFTPIGATEALSLDKTLALMVLLRAAPGASENLPGGGRAVRGRTHLHRVMAGEQPPMPELRQAAWPAGAGAPAGTLASPTAPQGASSEASQQGAATLRAMSTAPTAPTAPQGASSEASQQGAATLRAISTAPTAPQGASSEAPRQGDTVSPTSPIAPASSAPLPFPDGVLSVALPSSLLHVATLRHAQPGDVIRLFGHGSDQPLHRALQRTWLDEPFRAGIAVLAVGPRVLWVPGVCAAEETRLSSDTDTLLSLAAAPPWRSHSTNQGASRKEETPWTNK